MKSLKKDNGDEKIKLHDMYMHGRIKDLWRQIRNAIDRRRLSTLATFRIFDRNRDGRVSLEEAKTVIKDMLNIRASDEELKGLIKVESKY